VHPQRICYKNLLDEKTMIRVASINYSLSWCCLLGVISYEQYGSYRLNRRPPPPHPSRAVSRTLLHQIAVKRSIPRTLCMVPGTIMGSIESTN